MARKSKYEHLKDEVVTLFGNRHRPNDILQMFPYKDIPRQTLYDWYKDYRTENGIVEVKTELVKAEIVPRVQHRRQSTDFEATRYMFRTIIDNFEEYGVQYGIQAGLAMMRLIPLQLELPQELLTGEKEAGETVDVERSISNEERLERIKRRLNGKK